MIVCPSCGRAGGPFRLRHQIQADGQFLRSWSCACGMVFTATAGAERTANPQSLYTGFTIDWNGRPQTVTLRHIGAHETVWAMGSWSFHVSGPPDGPGTRIITLVGEDESSVGEWRLQPGWAAGEIGRRLKAWPLPPDLHPDLVARLLVHLLS